VPGSYYRGSLPIHRVAVSADVLVADSSMRWMHGFAPPGYPGFAFITN